MKLTLREKILITILLAVIFAWLGGCQFTWEASSEGQTSVTYLQNSYAEYNEQYFHNRLPKNIPIDMQEPDGHNMASTFCDDSGTNCYMHFNQKLVRAPPSRGPDYAARDVPCEDMDV